MKTVFTFLLLLAPATDPRADSTRNMADLLLGIYHSYDFKTDPNKPAERAAYYRQLLSQPVSLSKEAQARFDLATYLLQAGDSTAAVQEIEKLRSRQQVEGIVLRPAFDHDVTELHALACLRSGERRLSAFLGLRPPSNASRSGGLPAKSNT